MAALLSEANSICLMMNSLTEGIRLSVRPILSRLLAEDSANEHLQDDMKKIETFISHCENWSEVVGNLLSNVFGLKVDLMRCDVKDILSSVNVLGLENTDSQETIGGKGNRAYANEDEKEYADLVDRTNSIQAISFDGNVHSLSLQKIKESKEKVSAPMSDLTENNFEVLNSVEQLQKQLEESEGLIHDTEKRCTELHEKMLVMGTDLKSKEDENELLKDEIEQLKLKLMTKDSHQNQESSSGNNVAAEFPKVASSKSDVHNGGSRSGSRNKDRTAGSTASGTRSKTPGSASKKRSK